MPSNNSSRERNTLERFIASLELPEPVFSDEELRASAPPTREVKVDVDRLKRSGVLTPEFARSRLAEELRRIKFYVLSNSMIRNERSADHDNLVMVTSSGAGEGKTFMAINLAISISMEIDRTVLLVDGDTHRSGVANIFGIDTKLGFADLLSRPDLKVGDVLVNTDIDNLKILPAGTRIPNINEQVASQKMARLMAEMATRYANRIIILDSPPVLATAEANVLSRLVGQIVFVVEVGKTKQRDLVAALERLDHSKKIGFVLNKARERAETGNPYYDHYYGG